MLKALPFSILNRNINGLCDLLNNIYTMTRTLETWIYSILYRFVHFFFIFPNLQLRVRKIPIKVQINFRPRSSSHAQQICENRENSSPTT